MKNTACDPTPIRHTFCNFTYGGAGQQLDKFWFQPVTHCHYHKIDLYRTLLVAQHLWELGSIFLHGRSQHSSLYFAVIALKLDKCTGKTRHYTFGFGFSQLIRSHQCKLPVQPIDAGSTRRTQAHSRAGYVHSGIACTKYEYSRPLGSLPSNSSGNSRQPDLFYALSCSQSIFGALQEPGCIHYPIKVSSWNRKSDRDACAMTHYYGIHLLEQPIHIAVLDLYTQSHTHSGSLKSLQRSHSHLIGKGKVWYAPSG